MANYAGVSANGDNLSGIYAGVSYLYLNNQLAPETGFVIDNSLAGTLVKYIFTPEVKLRSGVNVYDYSDIIFNNYWVEPSKLDIGLVTQDINENIYIWNSYFIAKILNTIVNTVPQSVITTGALPQTLNPTEERLYPLLIRLVGAPDIDSTIKFEFTDFTLILPVLGDRIIQYSFNPVKSMTIKHNQKTLTSETTYKQQERRRLNDNEVRIIVLQIVKYKDTAFNLGVALGYGQDKAISVPIASEAMGITQTGLITGLTALNTATDISNYYELVNCQYLMLDNGVDIEILKILTVDYTTGAFIFNKPIQKSFNGNNTRMFPVVICYIIGYNVSQKQNNYIVYNLTFKEVV